MSINVISYKSGQTIADDGKIKTRKIAWLIRIITIIGITSVITYNLLIGIQINDPFILFATLMPIESLIMTAIGWFCYKNPTKKGDVIYDKELVSVIVPVFNQQSMIPLVVDSIANSTYKNIEIIAVNDGSTDGTKKILNKLKTKYPQLKVLHKKNGGKRSASLLGFKNSSGNYLVFIDSDSIVDQHAIAEFVKAFQKHHDAGGLVGHAKVWNAKKNMLTKIQDSWYDFSFNIIKPSESSLGNVMCCSGCLSCYRRKSIEKFLPMWTKDGNIQRNITYERFFKTNQWKSKMLANLSAKILGWASQFDDAEDSVLTSQTLVDWKTLYVSTAHVYTDVPETMQGFTKQQIRWKKGWFRATSFLSTFLWSKSPILAAIIYMNIISTFAVPVIMFVVFFYAPFVLHQYWIPLTYVAGMLWVGVSQGLDYKFRDPTSAYWKYKPLTNIITSFVLPWLIIPALLKIKKSQWLTR